MARGGNGTGFGFTSDEHATHAAQMHHSAEAQIRQAKKRLDRGNCDLAAHILSIGRLYQGVYRAHVRSSRGRLGDRDRVLARGLQESEQATKACYATRPPPNLPREVQLVLLDSIMENAKTDEERNAALIHAGRIRRYKMR